MDSQALNGKKNEMEKQEQSNLESQTTPEVVLETEKEIPTVEQAQEEKVNLVKMSKEQLCEHLNLVLKKDISTIKEEVETIKQSFYKKNQEELDEQREAYEAEGGDPKNFIPSTPKLEEEFKQLINQYKEKRSKYISQIKQQQEQNLLKKKHIIEQIKQLTDTHEDVSSNINVFKKLQQEWKETGDIPSNEVSTLWKDYNYYQDQFWDLVKINNELREYDFKKNLDIKTKLCEKAEELDKEENIIDAFRSLQKLHEEWRETGSVGREHREELWNRFKEASTVINKKHQSHFEKLHEEEDLNLEKKVALCEKLETFKTENLNTYKDWDNSTKEVMALQEEWRQIGYAPRKENKKVYARYRKACDTFFQAKSNFYKRVKAELNENLEKKKALCEQAEQLKESTDWKETGDKLVKIQKEWKEIGAVPRKHSDIVWKRFIEACDYFFEKRNENFSGQKQEEVENLKKKKAIIEQLENFEKAETEKESLATLRKITEEWKKVGHVPFKEKDKIYKSYRTALDNIFDELNIDKSQRRLDSFEANLEESGDDKLRQERRKLLRTYDYLKSEISTYENNLNFLNVSSKKGGGMLKEIERKIEGLKQECQLIEKKISIIDEKM